MKVRDFLSWRVFRRLLWAERFGCGGFPARLSLLDGFGRFWRRPDVRRGCRSRRRHSAGWAGLAGWRYPGSSRAATSRKRSCSGQADDRWKRTRLLLRVITAPIFGSLRRMVARSARAIPVPASPSWHDSRRRVRPKPSSFLRTSSSGVRPSSVPARGSSSPSRNKVTPCHSGSLDRPWRPGSCFWRKITSLSGPCSARQTRIRRSGVRRTGHYRGARNLGSGRRPYPGHRQPAPTRRPRAVECPPPDGPADRRRGKRSGKSRDWPGDGTAACLPRLSPSSFSQSVRLLPISTHGNPLTIPRRRMRAVRRSK